MAKKTLTFDTAFDTYTSCAVIGEGGAGRVYVVNNNAGEEFALKCLVPERITSERLKRFKNEIQFCQRHNHLNIVKVVDVGATLIKDVKCPFYVMNRYSDTLRTLMGKLKPDDIITLFSQILDGVEAAHLEEVWHRDLKPENILCEQSENSVLVADFGIAHFEEEEIYTAVETKAADRLANFQYSAPEQRVRDSRVDHRADIYALGLILNELFTGKLLQGAGYKKIADITTDYAYLDDLVEWMTQQNPKNRPESIENIKMELIGRKNEVREIKEENKNCSNESEKKEEPVDEDKVKSFPQSTVFFYERFCSAFPGVRGIKWFENNDEAIQRLSRLLVKPLKLKKEGGRSSFNPIWWWRKGNLHIDKFKRLDNDTVLLNWDEHKIDKIAAVNPGSYYQCFVYIQTKPMEPTGLYQRDPDDIERSVEIFGYCWEEYGLFRGKYKVTREEYDDGAAMIEGQLTDFSGETELRIRYITPYNIIIAAVNSPVGNILFDEECRKLMDGILQETSTIEDLSKSIQELPKPNREPWDD